jgi:RNA polymerase sigma factor (sigma-70 family)
MSEFTEEERAWLNSQMKSETAPDAETELIARDLANKLLTRLNPDDRLVLTLLDAEGFSVEEISRLTGWSISKVKVRAHRARAALRLILKELS